MKVFFRSIFMNAVSLWAISYAFPQVRLTSTWVLLLAAFVLSLLTIFIRPILKVLFLPVNLITFGLFSWVINVIVLWLATFLVPGFSIGNIVTPEIVLGPFIFQPVQFGPIASFIVVTVLLSLGNSVLSIFF